MKIIRDKKVLVEIKDVEYLRKIQIFLDSKTFKEENKDDMFIEYTNEDAIEFFAGRSDIVDYDVISNLTDEGIDNIVDKTKKRLAMHSDLWNEDRSRDARVEKLRYKRKIENYLEYKKNREKYDEYAKKRAKLLVYKMSIYEEEEEK